MIRKFQTTMLEKKSHRSLTMENNFLLQCFQLVVRKESSELKSSPPKLEIAVWCDGVGKPHRRFLVPSWTVRGSGPLSFTMSSSPRCYKLRSEDDIVNERGPLPLTVHDGTRNRRCGFPTPSHHTAISNLGGEDFSSDDSFLTTS